MKKLLFLAFVIGIGLGCGSNASQTADDTTQEAASANGNQFFGEKITADDAMPYDFLLAKLESQDSMETKVKGKVSGVCQAKGCWMTIVSDEAGKPEMFVKFKDYGFFMPKDIAGREVVMRGKAYREMTTVEELKHYAEDEGKSKEEIEKITEPEEELKFMADGVVLLAGE